MSIEEEVQKYAGAMERADLDTAQEVLLKACYDPQLEQAIINWHSVNDGEVIITEEERAKIKQIVDDVLRKYL